MPNPAPLPGAGLHFACEAMEEAFGSKLMVMPRRKRFGVLPDGSAVDVITLAAGGLEMNVLTYGCIIASLSVPDSRDRPANVVLGFDSLGRYLAESPYFGAVVGRYANRVRGARFVIDGREHHLSPNEPPNHLHGGFKGFDKHVWDAEPAENGRAIVFRRQSANGEEGYPGALDVQVTYMLAEHELHVSYEARSELPTHVNLTQHSYFTLSGTGDVLEHCLTINANTYLPVDEQLIPTGEPAPVANSPFDFQDSVPIGARLNADHPQLKRAGGYDHNFILNTSGSAPSVAARVVDPVSRRSLEIRTTEPGLQFYSGQVVGHRGFCLEPQHHPDSPNRSDFPSTLLRPGERYESRTIYAFNR